MHEARLDALVVTSRHNVQYLLGGYRFFFFDAMEAIGVSRYLPVYVYQRGRPENALYIGNRMEGFERNSAALRRPRSRPLPRVAQQRAQRRVAGGRAIRAGTAARGQDSGRT